MQRTADFLASLDDCELSFLYAYKYSTYLPESQKLFDEELLKRRLGKIRIWDYVKKYQFNPENTGCPCCNSQKMLDADQCMICGYYMSMEEERKKSKFWKIMDVVGVILELFGH